MIRTFTYSRKAKKQKLDDQGQPIPINDEKGKQTGWETEEVVYEDSFNLAKYIRSYTMSPTEIVVLLDDGHEETQMLPAVKGVKGGQPERFRRHVQSEITISGEDIDRFRKIIKSYEN